jgi:nucleoid DNA-binding protein
MNLKAKIEDVIGALAADGEVTVRGFGKFGTRRIAERDYYIPATGETRKIPAHEVIVFRPTRALTEKLKRGKEIAAQITALEQQIANLEARYGKGVRPEWVGEDIAMMDGRLRQLRADLTNLSA